MANTKKENDFGTGIPNDVMESLARALLPEIRAFYESEEGKAAFEQWKPKENEVQININLNSAGMNHHPRFLILKRCKK